MWRIRLVLIMMTIFWFIISYNVIFDLYKYTQTVKWTKYPCTIINSDTEFHGKGGCKIIMTYSYVVNNKKYTSWKYEITDTVFYENEAININNLYKPGTKTICYVNPSNPEEAVINNGLTSSFYSCSKGFILFSIFLIATVCYYRYKRYI